MPPLTVIVLPHSHWDREWYHSFEEFRFELAHFMDDLLSHLEGDPAIQVFLLDGQVVLLDDYLEIRPENRDRLQALVLAGRLLIGPWYVQPDEFLVSPEALIRNLLIGDRSGRQFGPVMRHGYVPDTFGHVAQLPQILQEFGISTFFFMRGLGADLRELHAEFWWQAPNGSRVLAHYLSETYSNAAVLDPNPVHMALHHGKSVDYETYFELRDRLAARASNHVILLLNGGDHLAVQAEFARALAGLDAAVPDHIRNGSLDDFAQAVLADQPDLQVLTGELRFGRYQPVLRDVLSTRLYLKQANERAQQALEGLAERFAALSLAAGGQDFAPFLRHAWTVLLKNHAHDSICGCSVDVVHREMLTRFAQVEQVAQKIVDATLHDLATRAAGYAAEDGQIPVVVFNPSPWVRGGRVRCAVAPFAAIPLGQRVFDWEREAIPIDLSSCTLQDPSGANVPFQVIGKQLFTEDLPHRRKNVERSVVEFMADAVPPLGWQVYRLTPVSPGGAVGAPSYPAQMEKRALENEFLRVVVEPDGTLTLTDKTTGQIYHGLNQLVDEGDAGDEYTFSPPMTPQACVSTEEEWSFDPPPDAFTLVVRGHLRLPEALDGSRQARLDTRVVCDVVTTVRLLPQAHRVELSIELTNRARDHRLRAAFPTGFSQVTYSTAETAFGVIERPTSPEASVGWREQTSSTYAQRRFVCVEANGHGLALVNKGLPEYEVSPDGRIWLTLLRAVGWLSRDDLTKRPGHAGPAYPTPEAQCPGTHTLEYAIVPYHSSWSQAELFREAEEYWLPLVAHSVQGIRASDLPPLPFVSFLRIDPPQAILSCLKPAEDDDGIILRLYNPEPTPLIARLNLGLPVTSAWHVNLNEEVQAEAVVEPSEAGSEITLPLAPAEVRTLKVRFTRQVES